VEPNFSLNVYDFKGPSTKGETADFKDPESNENPENTKSAVSPLGISPLSVAVRDFNNDQKLALAVADDGTDDLQILLQAC
jgi:hypothetical protein